jgi:hypothetical protein
MKLDGIAYVSDAMYEFKSERLCSVFWAVELGVYSPTVPRTAVGLEAANRAVRIEARFESETSSGFPLLLDKTTV